MGCEKSKQLPIHLTKARGYSIIASMRSGLAKEPEHSVLWRLLGVTVTILLVGCQANVHVDRDAPAWPPAAQPAPHNLSLLAVDFDPPLDEVELVAGQGVTLLAAIQNNGEEAERNVPVVARLYDVDPMRSRVSPLIESTAYVGHVEPGQITIVCFERITSLPLRPRYYLTVEVAGVDREVHLLDNVQRLGIEIEPTPTSEEAAQP